MTADDESDSKEEAEVIASLSHFQLESCFSEMMRKYETLLSKYKTLKNKFVVTFENSTNDEQNVSNYMKNYLF